MGKGFFIDNDESMKISVYTDEEIRQIVREEMSNNSLANPDLDSPNKKYYLEEAARYLGLAAPTFRVHQNKIGGVKIGRRWIFTKAELDRYKEKHRRKTAEEIRESIV